jgi:hypothetical protein
MTRTAIVMALGMLCLWAAPASAQTFQLDDPAGIFEPDPNPPSVPVVAAPTRILIIGGLSGDAPHHRAFADTIAKLHDALVASLSVPTENITVLFGDEADDKDGPMIKAASLSTREGIAAAVEQLRQKLSPEDRLWVFTIGHAYYDGRDAWLNLPGPDLAQAEFGKLFAGLASAQQVFFLGTPVSGQFIKPLAAPGRVIISATESDWETNETEFPEQFATLLASPPTVKELDIDQDGQISLFDLYITLAKTIAQSYLDREYLSTEHCLLEDNGDGRGTELQIDFLSEDLGGRVRRGKRITRPMVAGAEGMLSKTILLPLGKAEEPAKSQESQTAPTTPTPATLE